METVDLKYLRIMEERIQRQIAVLRRLSGEVEQTEEGIRHLSYMEEPKQRLRESKKAMDENIQTLVSMASVLREVCQKYQGTEERIADQYNLDVVIYPETRFAASRITGMEEYQFLMPF